MQIRRKKRKHGGRKVKEKGKKENTAAYASRHSRKVTENIMNVAAALSVSDEGNASGELVCSRR